MHLYVFCRDEHLCVGYDKFLHDGGVESSMHIHHRVYSPSQAADWNLPHISTSGRSTLYCTENSAEVSIWFKLNQYYYDLITDDERNKLVFKKTLFCIHGLQLVNLYVNCPSVFIPIQTVTVIVRRVLL